MKEVPQPPVDLQPTAAGDAAGMDIHPALQQVGVEFTSEQSRLEEVRSAVQSYGVQAVGADHPVSEAPDGSVRLEVKDARPVENAGKWSDLIKRKVQLSKWKKEHL